MTTGSNYSQGQPDQSASRYSAHYTSFPYSHYFHLNRTANRSESSPETLPPDSSQEHTGLLNGHLNADIGAGQGIHLDAGGEVGGKHGLGVNAGGNLGYKGGDLHANGHLGSQSYGINAGGSSHLNSSQGLGVNAEAQALGKYGLAAQAKTQLGGGQGAGFQTGAQLGGENGLSANAEGHLGLSQGAGFNTNLQLGGDKGIGAQAKAQLGGGQGAGLGFAGQLGNYNGEVGFNIGGKKSGTEDSKE